jgi:hypothetical protein
MRLLLLSVFLLCAAAFADQRSWEGFVRHAEDEKRGYMAIRSQAEYDAFVDSIPKTRVQMKQPAPPSSDPLLLKPPVDFAQHALVVIWSHNIHIDAKIVGTERDGDDLVVHTAFDAPTRDVEMMARPYGVGQYHAVEVDTFPGELRLGQINKKAP